MSARIVDPTWCAVARSIRAEAKRYHAPLVLIQRAMHIGLRTLDSGRTPAVSVGEATKLFRNVRHPHNGPATA